MVRNRIAEMILSMPINFQISQLYHHIIIIGVRFYKNIPERLRMISTFRGVVFFTL